MPQVRIIAGESSSGWGFGYELPPGEFHDLSGFCDRFGELIESYPTQEERVLAIANVLLAHQRPFAYDHERTGVMFHGASLLETEKGNWFLTANIQLPNAEVTRNCAENMASTEAGQVEGHDFRIKNLWFMGGKGNFEEGQPKQEFINNKFQRNTPCGSCLDVIMNHGTSETLVHMVPLNDGTEKLIPGSPDPAGDLKNLKREQVFTRRIGDLLPHVSHMVPDPKGKIKEMIRDAYAWIKNPEGWQAPDLEDPYLEERRQLKQMEKDGVSPDERLVAIRNLLMKATRDYYQEDNKNPGYMNIAVGRTMHGGYFVGRLAKNGEAPAMSHAAVHALEAAHSASKGNKITDVFTSDYSDSALANLDKLAPDAPIPLAMPDGATRERVKKITPKNGEALIAKNFWGNPIKEQGATIHTFIPNDPTKNMFDPEKHIISEPMKSLLPFGYQNPKSVVSGSQYEGNCACCIPYNAGFSCS